MSHKTMINGTLYEIDKGKSLVEGTIREIDHGKTLVGGTVYEEGFTKPMALVKISSTYTSDNSFWYVTIDGVNHSMSGDFEVPMGTQIYCHTIIDDYDDDGNPVNLSYYGISINGTYIKAETYNYTVNSDVIITLKSSRYGESMDITEIPEGHAVVNITGTGSTRVMGKICAVTVDGVDYTSATQLVVPVGTVVSCTVSTMSTYNLDKGWVKINGVTVLTASDLNETYNYTVSGNVTINMSTQRNVNKDTNGYITITE